MMALVRPEQYSRSRALFAAYTAKSPAYLRARFLDHKKPSLGTKMRSVAKRTAAETFARMLAVTAMLVIAGFIFPFALNAASLSPSALTLSLEWDDVFLGDTT